MTLDDEFVQAIRKDYRSAPISDQDRVMLEYVDVIEKDEKHVTIESIQKFVAEYYGLKVAELKSRNNSKSVAMPRQVAMHLCKSLTHASLPEIGRSFGGKHHSTVIHSIKKVDELRKKDPHFNSLIESLLQHFR